MTDMRPTIIPKSDQLNADDLISGPRTVTITSVSVRPGTEQPVAISFQGDNSKPYKPCKSMCRVMVAMWGPDAKEYTGRSMTLYRDPKVKWAGLEVGGIRISHMSHIERDHVMALTETRASRKPFTVKPLRTNPEREAPPPSPDPPAEEPVETSERAAGQQTEFLDDVDREVAKEDAAKRVARPTKSGKAWIEQIQREMDDHGGDPANVRKVFASYGDVIEKLPEHARQTLRDARDEYIAAIEGSLSL